MKLAASSRRLLFDYSQNSSNLLNNQTRNLHSTSLLQADIINKSFNLNLKQNESQLNEDRKNISALSSTTTAETAHINLTTTPSSLLLKEWSGILTKAEKTVGYSTSFLNLRYLVSDEVAQIANLVRKLMKTKHPIIKMARRFMMQTNEETDTNNPKGYKINGLVILLISKAAGLTSIKTNSWLPDVNSFDGIHKSQRRLAEIAEMITMGSLIHKSVLDLHKLTPKSTHFDDMNQGNKLAVLCGDYLLANACTNLAKLNNTKVKTFL
jgi:hypothetical protein